MNYPSIAPLAASLKGIDSAAAQRARVLFNHGLSRALGQWVPALTIAPANPPAEPSGPAAGDGERFSVLLQGSGAEVSLLLPSSLDTVVAAILAAGSWSSTVQLSCLCVRAQATLGGLMRWLGTLGLHPVRLESRPAELPLHAGDTHFVCRVGKHHIEGCLRSTDPDWLTQAESATSRLGASPWAQAAGLALPVRAQLGARRLRLGLLRSLQVGDVVLLDGRATGPSQAGMGLVQIGARRGRGAVGRACSFSGHEITLLGDRWMSTETLHPRAPSAHDAEPAAADHGTASDPMADIEVDLHFELQVLSTPLAELAAMRPGYVLELPVPAAQACVSLVVGGQVVGRAQLISVGDRLGARILELFSDAG